jgi:hypothetical protein
MTEIFVGGTIVVLVLIILGIKAALSEESTPKTFKSQEENLNIIRQWVTYFGVVSIISLVSTVLYIFYLSNK